MRTRGPPPETRGIRAQPTQRPRGRRAAARGDRDETTLQRPHMSGELVRTAYRSGPVGDRLAQSPGALRTPHRKAANMARSRPAHTAHGTITHGAHPVAVPPPVRSCGGRPVVQASLSACTGSRPVPAAPKTLPASRPAGFGGQEGWGPPGGGRRGGGPLPCSTALPDELRARPWAVPKSTAGLGRPRVSADGASCMRPPCAAGLHRCRLVADSRVSCRDPGPAPQAPG